jgi:hypothetical protein
MSRSCVIAATILLALISPATALAQHTYSHGRLHCNLNSVYAVGDTMRASVVRGERVRVNHILYRWTGSTWVVAAHGKTVFAGPAGRSTEVFGDLSTWYRSNGTADAEGTSSAFTVNWRGYYYAIVEEIAWLNSAGWVVDQHRDTIYKNTGGYHCYV